MRRLAIGVAIGLVALVAVDFGLRLSAESWLAREVKASLRLKESPEISIGGFPFLAEVARGRLASASLDADGLIAQGLRLDRFHLELADLDVPVGTMLTRGSGAVVARRGTGSIVVTDEDMSAFLSTRSFPGRVRFRDGRAEVDSHLSFLGQSLEVHSSGPVSIEGGKVVYRPTEANAGGSGSIPLGGLGFSFDLPPPLPGISYGEIALAEGTATIGVTARDVRFAV